MKKNVILLLLFTVTAALSFSQTVVGTISWVDGIVDVYRDGEAIDYWDVDIGLEIEDFDLIETGDDGYAEIEVQTPGNSGTVVKISKNTAFYFDSAKVDGGSKTTFQLLAGSLSMKVGKLTGNNAVDVRTESAVMGVRGTEFEVSLAPEGSVLVTCVEGDVEVGEEKRSSKAHAKPGSIVRKDYNGNVKGFQVGVDDIDLYKSFWLNQREQIFKSGARGFVQHYAKLYNQTLPKFLLAYEKLKDAKATLIKYGTIENATMGSLIKAKKEVSTAIFEVRSIFPLFEHTFYSLQIIEDYHDDGLGIGAISSELSSTAFFAGFSSSKKTLKKQMADVRRMFKLYLAIDKASGGTGILDSIFGGGNPLDGGGLPSGNVPQGSIPSF